MKKKLFVVLCAGMMMTGCAAQGSSEQKEPEVISLDLGGNTQNDETNKEQANTAVSDIEETVQSNEIKESQEPEAESTLKDNTVNVQNSENTQDLYMQFINNEVPVIIGKDSSQSNYIIFDEEQGKSFTFAELGQYVNQIYFDPEYSEKSAYDYAQYTYVECPDSDSRNFLIKFVGMNIYSQGDDSFVVYVIMEDNGQLYLTDEYECWARSYTELFQNGLCVSGGSGGAGDHYSGVSAIMSSGKITDIYAEETLSGWWTSYVSETIFREVFDGDMEAPLNVSIYTIGEEEYYTYDLSECTDEQVTLSETYINRCRDDAGINWVTDEEVERAIEKRSSSMGVDYDMSDVKEAEWTTV